MASLVKTAMVKIVADDGDTQEKLDRIAAKAEELGRLNPDIKVKIDAAAASAEMAVLRKELKDSAKEADHTHRSFFSLAQMLGGTDTSGEEGMGLVGALDNAGNALSGAPAMWGGLAVAIAVAATALMPFIAGLSLVTVGVGTFAALAVPEISKVWTAITTAGTAGAAAMKALSPDERALVDPVRDLRSEFSGLQKAIQPEVMKAFAEGLKTIKDLMPALRPLVVAAGQALDGFLKNIDKWLQSSSGQKFIHWLEFEGPRAMAAFGRDLWDTTKIIGRVFDFLYNEGESMDRTWKTRWHEMAEVVDGFRIGFTQMGDEVKRVAANIGTGFQQLGHQIENALDTARGNLIGSGHDVETWANDIGQYTMDAARWFQQLPGRIMSALASLPGMLLSIGENAMHGLLSGLESAFGPVLGWAEHAASDLSGAFARVLSIFSPSLVFRRHGQMIAAGLVLGMNDGHGQVMAAAQRMAAATLGGSAGGYGPGAGGSSVIRWEIVGGQGEWEQFMATWIRKYVRINGGGSTQTAFGRP